MENSRVRSGIHWRGIAALSLLLGSSSLVGAPEQSPKWLTTYGDLLSKYVTDSGVRYAAWKNTPADMQAIERVVEAIAQEKVSGLKKNEQLAFYINAYNAWILHEALAKYPTTSVKDLLFTFFLSKRIKVAGEKMSFDNLEKDIIRKKFNEPRVHFALNCASRSCPPLNPEPFRGEKLDAQLEKVSVAFVNSQRGVDYNRDEKYSGALRDFQLVQGRLQSCRRPARLHQPTAHAAFA